MDELKSNRFTKYFALLLDALRSTQYSSLITHHSSLITHNSVFAEGDHRIDFGGSPCGQEHGQERDHGQYRTANDIRPGIGGADAVKQVFHKARQKQANGQPDSQPNGSQSHAPTDDQLEHVAGLRTESHDEPVRGFPA